ncbi:MAG: amino acid permease [Alphaproteobacteria bacterium 64-11]|nr:amino acid permease [Alphaproteobacteria bacterium]OJU12169.1 MAG: amino acid permease [Alphaproteobacteria bacterium 64-11]
MWRVKSLDAVLRTAEKKSLHRSLGPVQLTLLGIGGVIGTGIFVLTAEAAQKAGPGMMISFVIAGAVSAVAALCYAELASMVPVSGSAYTYSYAVLGELVAWLVGWALILEYAVAASAVAVGWSGYIVGLLAQVHIVIPPALAAGPYAGGVVNLLAVFISMAITILLVIGTRESANVNAVLVLIKLVALGAFIALAVPVIKSGNFHPFLPNGWGTVGVVGAAASIFFAYVGFDAVSTAAEETKNPQRNLPIGLIGSLAICTVIYLVVAAGAIGSFGAQPVYGPHGEALEPGSMALAAQCAGMTTQPLVCSREALAHVLRAIHHPLVGNLLGLAAGIALPTVILMMLFGQTRIFFVMSRDGLLPEVLSRVHPRFKTPHVVTWITGVCVAVAAAFLPVGQLADISNSGTLFAFAIVSIAVLVLRYTAPDRARPFRTPWIWFFAPLSAGGCIILFFFLPAPAMILFPVWSAIGLVFYFAYGYRNSHVGRGVTEVPELDPDAPALIEAE